MSSLRTCTLVVVAVLALSACDPGAAADSPPVTPGATEHEIWLQEMEFVPASIEVPAGEVITLHLDNVGNMRHDLRLSDGTQSAMLNPGESQTLEIGPLDSDLTGICAVPGHEQAGMTFTVRVSE